MVTTTIRIQDFTSYSPSNATTVVLEKPTSLFYGANGVGKSTIIRVVRHHLDPNLGPAGKSSVSVSGLVAPEFLIYDVDYIEDTFRTKDSIRGIFTLGKRNEEELAAVAGVEASIRDLEGEEIRLASRLQQLSGNLDRALVDAKEGTWAIKTDYEKGPLKYCLDIHKVRGDKVKLFEHLRQIPLSDDVSEIEDLLREAGESEDETAEEKVLLTLPEFNFGYVEADNSLVSLSIVASTDSRLSPLIARLGSEAWIRAGRPFLAHSDGACPFCQQALPHDFTAELSKLFDSVYESQLADLASQRDLYQAKRDAFSQWLDGKANQDEYVTGDLEFQNATKDLMLLVDGNLRKLSEKLGDPSRVVSLDATAVLSANVKALAEALVTRAEEFNLRLRNRAKVRSEIDSRFWQRLRKDFASHIAGYERELERIRTETTEVKAASMQVTNDLGKARSSLAELRKSSTNIDASIESINLRIRNLGIRGFTIERDPGVEGYYHIARGPKGKASYKSLSEGEKTLVTFLYFLESLQGSHRSDGLPNKENRIIFVDDPVSSLSHNHVYDIASLIKRHLLDSGEFPQVVVLTHSLFFYHELLKLIDGDRSLKNSFQCFRVTKAEFTDICKIGPSDVRNDYQAHWLVLGEAMHDGRYSVAIPIAMRYILEHYFAFVGYRDRLYKALESLGDKDEDFRPFYRYINRQAHGDDINISDLPSVEANAYIEKFKAVFVATGQDEHFHKMLAQVTTS